MPTEPNEAEQDVKTVADQFAETLAIAGVKRIYGIVGDSLNGLTDTVRRQGKIEWVHVRHEEVAAFAAGAEAHLTGELAVTALGTYPIFPVGVIVLLHQSHARAPSNWFRSPGSLPQSEFKNCRRD